MSSICQVIQLVCLDVDGTLIGGAGEVTSGVWSSTDEAREAGMHVCLCTARGAFGASWEMAQRLDPNGWHVFHGGSAIVHTADGRVVASELDSGTIERAHELATENDWTLETYAHDRYVVNAASRLATDHAALMHVDLSVGDLRSLSGQPIVRLQYVVTEDALPHLRSCWDDEPVNLTAATSPMNPGSVFVSINSPQTTKATGIEAICSELGLELANVMMVGDGENDIAALDAVGYPVAMGNASSEVKSHARSIVSHVDDDGVVDAITMALNSFHK